MWGRSPVGLRWRNWRAAQQFAGSLQLKDPSPPIALENGTAFGTVAEKLGGCTSSAAGTFPEYIGTSATTLGKSASVGTTFGQSGAASNGLTIASAPTPNTLTSCGWRKVRVTFVGLGRQMCAYSIENTAGTVYQLQEGTFNANTWEAHDSAQGGFLFTDTFTVDSWLFVAEVNAYGGSGTTLYWMADGGTSLSSTTGNDHGSFTTQGKVIIGTNDAGGQNEFLDGALAMVRFWQAELTPTELLAEALSPTPVRTANLWADYRLDGAANKLTDYSGNSRNLSVISGSGWADTPGPTSVTVGGNSVTSTATGVHATYLGTVAQTLGDATSTASGTFTSSGYTGTVAATLDAVTDAASGTFPFTGTSAQTLGTVTDSASGAVGNAGTVAVTLAAVTDTASGTFPFTGTSAQTLAAATSTASGTHTPYVGTLAQTLDAVTDSASGTFPFTGTSAQTLDAATSTASGTFTAGTSITGTADATLDAATSTATGSHTPYVGTVSATCDAATATATGTFATPVTGTLNQALGVLVAEVAGTHTPYVGVCDVVLDAATAAALGVAYTPIFFVVTSPGRTSARLPLSSTSAVVTGPNDAVIGG